MTDHYLTAHTLLGTGKGFWGTFRPKRMMSPPHEPRENDYFIRKFKKKDRLINTTLFDNKIKY